MARESMNQTVCVCVCVCVCVRVCVCVCKDGPTTILTVSKKRFPKRSSRRQCYAQSQVLEQGHLENNCVLTTCNIVTVRVRVQRDIPVCVCVGGGGGGGE